MENKKFLYQPTQSEDINNNNIVMRNCVDRFETMISFCNNYFKNDIKEKTLLDIGSSYGYFVFMFNKYFNLVEGIERDKQQIKMSNIFYPSISDLIKMQKFPIDSEAGYVDYTKDKKYNVVLLLSVLQHAIIEEGEDSALNMIKEAEDRTEDIMFFEMAEDHEDWYRDKIPGWNKNSIKKWILKNTNFNFCDPIMTDSDSKKNFNKNYGRTLFACYR